VTHTVTVRAGRRGRRHSSTKAGLDGDYSCGIFGSLLVLKDGTLHGHVMQSVSAVT
jgi:hypothetical protein